MKKIFYLFLIITLFFIGFSISKAVTESAFSGFSTSFDIGNFMSSNYTRWIYNTKTQKCEEVNYKSNGDYATESECKAANIKTNYTVSDSFTSTNQNLWSQPTETEKPAKTPEYQVSGQINSSFNNWAVTTSSTKAKPLVSDNIFNSTNQTLTAPSITPQSVSKPKVATSFDSSSIIPSNPLTVAPPEKTAVSFLGTLLEGLGIMKPSSITNNPAKIEILGGDGLDPLMPGESEAENGFIWYNKEYAFKVERLVSEMGKGSDTIDTKYNYNSSLPITISVKIRKKSKAREEVVGILYSYINNKDERVFDNFEFVSFIPAYINSPQEYYNRSFYTYPNIPNDIKIENDKGTIEFFVVIRPTYYAHYKTPDNNYRVWREAEKSIITFDFEDDSFDTNYLKSYCKFSFAEPIPKSNFLDNKDPYYINFKLSLNMECDTSYMRNKTKTVPKDIWVSYKMDCPNHFDSDWRTHLGNYSSEFLNNSKEFINKVQIDINEPKFSTNLVLENTTLIDILRDKYHSISVNPNAIKLPFAFDLSQRCDLTAYVYSNGEQIAQLKDYFYLNQCNVNIINKHPDWTYCTENKYGNPAPIDVKTVFVNCAHDNSDNLDSIIFVIFPNPNQKIKSIYDSDFQYQFYINADNLHTDDKLGQTIYTNINGTYTFKRYFEATKVTKHMAKGPSHLSFNLGGYYVDQSVIRAIPPQHWGLTDQFKIYYGYNEECDNIIVLPTDPQPTIPRETTTSTKGEDSQPQPGFLRAVINFFTELFK